MYTIGGWNIEYIKSIHRIKECDWLALRYVSNFVLKNAYSCLVPVFAKCYVLICSQGSHKCLRMLHFFCFQKHSQNLSIKQIFTLFFQKIGGRRQPPDCRALGDVLDGPERGAQRPRLLSRTGTVSRMSTKKWRDAKQHPYRARSHLRLCPQVDSLR